MENYSFGVEIEMIAEPHKIRNDLVTLHALYYAKIAAALRNRGLPAASDELQLYRKHPEHYDKWWITKDGSLPYEEQRAPVPLARSSRSSRSPPAPPAPPRFPPANRAEDRLVPIEAVSPILDIRGSWEADIDVFWTAMAAVFHQPVRSPACGSHIHMSRGVDAKFALGQLKTIAFGIVVYESNIQAMLMDSRQNNRYCEPNSTSSPVLRACRNDIRAIAAAVNNVQDTNALFDVMQRDRYVLWNFENTLPGGSGTIEFRGGRFLRGNVRTKRWIAFVISLVHWLLRKRQNLSPRSVASMRDEAFYNAVRSTAAELGMYHLLPQTYLQLNETSR